MADADGHWPQWLKTVAFVVATVAIVAAVAAIAVASGGTALPVIVGAAVGFAASEAIDTGSQLAKSKGKWNKINPHEVIRSGCIGGISGALGGTGAGLSAQVVGNAALGAGGTVADAAVNKKKIDIGKLVVNTVVGGISGLAGREGAQFIPKTGDIVRYSQAENVSIFSRALTNEWSSKAAMSAVGRSGIVGIGGEVTKFFIFGDD